MTGYPQGLDRLMEFIFDRMPEEPVETIGSMLSRINAKLDAILEVTQPREMKMNDTQLMAEILKELEKARAAVEGHRDLMGGLSERLRWVEVCTRQVAHRLKIGAINEVGD